MIKIDQETKKLLSQKFREKSKNYHGLFKLILCQTSQSEKLRGIVAEIQTYQLYIQGKYVVRLGTELHTENLQKDILRVIFVSD